MNNERDEDDEIDLTCVQRVTSNDSLEHNESNISNLRLISGYHKWTNINDNIRVEKSNDNNNILNNNEELLNQNTSSIINKNIKYDIEDNTNSSGIDLSLNHFDLQLQVNNGQLQQAIRYEVFSSISLKDLDILKLDQYSQTIEPEVDMEHGNERRNGNHKGYSQQYNGNNNNNNNDNNNRRNRQTNGSSGNGGSGSADGNGSNPNRNNNNSRRPNGNDDSGDNEDDDNDNDNETDENIARRLGFRPIDNETVRVIGRLRRLTSRQSFDRRDFENVQHSIDDLIRLQHLENSPPEQLEKIVHYLKLNRILRTKPQALAFIQERLPRRNQRSHSNNNSDSNSNVFDLWRERERRARLDSKDSLEDDTQNSTGQQLLRDVSEVNHPTPLVTLTTHTLNATKVKQMAKNIDTKSESSRTGDGGGRSSSPSPINLNRSFDSINRGAFVDDRSRGKRNSSPGSISEQHRVRQMIDRLESSTTSLNTKGTRKISTKKSFHDEHSDGSASITSSPSIKRATRRENHENSIINNNTGAFVFHQSTPPDDTYFRDNNSKVTRFELNREEIMNGGQRIASGATTDDYITSLVPGAETSISMVRDVRACLYDVEPAITRIGVENIPVKVDVETLYILEQKSEKKSLPSVDSHNIHIQDYDYNRLPSSHQQQQQHDFAMQTPVTTIKVSNRPMGTQVDSTVERSTVAAQTTDSLHRPVRERQSVSSTSPLEDDEERKVIRTTTTTTRYEVKRRHSSHHTSEDEDGTGSTVIYIDDKDNFQFKHRPIIPVDDQRTENISEQRSTFNQATSHLSIDQKRDVSRNTVRRHVDRQEYDENEQRSAEVYEIHTRGACKCLVVSYEEKTQYGSETRFEKQLKRIERTYTNEELKSTELHVIVTSSDGEYQLVRRDYGSNVYFDDNNIEDKANNPSITIHYYTKEGHRMRTEQERRLEHLPLFIRCEIEYELNHYGSAQLVLLSATNCERRQMNVSVKKEIVDEIVSRTSGRLKSNSPELEHEISQQLAELISLLHLVDYSSRDDYNHTSSTDVRRVSRTDVTTSLRIVQRYRTVIHRLCQIHRSHLRLTAQAEKQRHLILVARDEYYLLDLAAQTTGMAAKKTTHHEVIKCEVAQQKPFDYAKYRRETEQQQRILEQHYRQTNNNPPPPSGHQSEAEFYLGSGRRALIEREIHSMRESIRPHEHAPPRYKNEPPRRSLSVSYSGGQRYVRARIIHVKDYYDDSQQQVQQQVQQQQNAKEQELFVRVDDYINESAANSLRRSYSTDYLQEDGPRSRIRYIRIPGETIKIEEKTTYEYQGVMYTDLPYALRYWNILYILDREAREGRPLGSSLPHVIVNDPYRTVIPPLTQQEIRQTAQQVLSPQYPARSYTDRTLRWFLSRDNRTEVESNKYLQTLQHCRKQQQQQQQHHHRHQHQHHQHKQSGVQVRGGGQAATAKKYYVTETLVRYEKMPDRLVPVSVNDRAQSTDNIHHRSPSVSRNVQQSFHSQTHLDRSQSQPRPRYQPSPSNNQTSNFRAQLPTMHSPLSRHQSVHELHAPSTLSHPPSPSPSLHSLHSNHNYSHQLHRRPVAFNNRYPTQNPAQTQHSPVFTEIIDSQTGRKIVTTSQEQLPTEVLGLLNKYNLQ
ncbi:unnamed protein product [Adineta steineri]|uniref:Uncharacterized protein n=1 Tax=Adineta steineri TaxID=433720 RepID=A0A818ZVD7_9BILA|nr:unnamed protein product [Adineta steineri]CAF3775432.1 unnamed protein product [Adineta steineri]